MMDSIRLTMAEKDSYDYVYIDEENQVHLLCPLVGGETIGLDNTCKSTYELKQFFGKDSEENENKSAAAVLKRYISDLKTDIALLSDLDNATNELERKKERLAQIETYLESVEKVSNKINFRTTLGSFGKYPPEVEKLLKRQTNCSQILLSPKKPDSYLNGTDYIFSVKRGLNDVSGKALREAFSGTNMAEIKTSSVKDTILQEVVNNLGEKKQKINNELISKIRDVLQKKIEEQSGQKVNLSQSSQNINVDMSYFDNVLTIAEGEEVQPKEIANTILLACLSDNFWGNLSTSPFKDAAAILDPPQDQLKSRPEQLSILTQFFLAEVNVFCFANGKSKENFGKVLDNNTNKIRDLLASAVKTALAKNKNVEEALIACINNNKKSFGLRSDILGGEVEKIIKRFKMEYTVIKDGSHMDEFSLFLPDNKGGVFANHKNRISFPFAHFALEVEPNNQFFKNHLRSFDNKKERKLSPKNNIAQPVTLGNEQLVMMMQGDPSTLAKMLFQKNDMASTSKGINLDQLSQKDMESIMYFPICKELKKEINTLIQKDPELHEQFYNKFSADFILNSAEKFIMKTDSWPPSFDINIKYKDDKTVLIYAIEKGNVELVNALLEKGSDPNLADKNGRTALMHAIQGGNIDIFNSLLAKGANPDLVDDNGRTALMHASLKGNTYIFNALLAKGANPGLVDDNGRTALMHAIQGGNIDIFNSLLAKEKDLDRTDKNEQTALMHAIQVGNIEIFNALLEKGAKLNLVDNDGQTALMHAIQGGNIDIFNALLAKGAKLNLVDNDGRTALMHAIQRGNIDIFNALLAKEKDLDRTDNNKQTALMHAIQGGNIGIFNALLEKGAPLDAKNKQKALELAIQERNIDIFNTLLEKGADLDKISMNDKQNALVLTLKNQNFHTSVKLLQAGAGINNLNATQVSTLVDHISLANKSTLIITLSNIDNSKLTAEDKKNNRDKLLAKINEGPRPSNLIVRILITLASYKATSGIAAYLSRRLKYKELHSKPTTAPITPTVNLAVTNGDTTGVLLNIMSNKTITQNLKDIKPETVPEKQKQQSVKTIPEPEEPPVQIDGANRTR